MAGEVATQSGVRRPGAHRQPARLPAGIPLFSGPTTEMPLRPLVGANMPAVMIELGFLTNADDEKELVNGVRATKTIDAILATIAEIRGGALLQATGAAAR